MQTLVVMSCAVEQHLSPKEQSQTRFTLAALWARFHQLTC